MAGYSQPIYITYPVMASNFASPAVRQFRGPKGMRGRVTEVTVAVTTAFVGTTTPGKLRVGDSVTANKYADLDIGAAGAGTGANDSVLMSDNPTVFNKQDSAGIAPDSEFYVTPVAPTGGAPAGVADILVTIAWY
jgi:hypothetical protein